MDGDKCNDLIFNDTTDTPPKCPKCRSFVKPDIFVFVFVFGERLPDRFHTVLSQDVEQVDLLLVIGTSLQVAPVSHIPQYVQCQRRVLINRDEVGDFMCDEDVVLLGDCDDVVMNLARELEWEHEMRTLHKKTKIKPKNDAATANEDK